MEIFGTNFSLSLGAWRFRFVVAIEDTDAMPAPKPRQPHHVRFIPENEYVN